MKKSFRAQQLLLLIQPFLSLGSCSTLIEIRASLGSKRWAPLISQGLNESQEAFLREPVTAQLQFARCSTPSWDSSQKHTSSACLGSSGLGRGKQLRPLRWRLPRGVLPGHLGNLKYTTVLAELALPAPWDARETSTTKPGEPGYTRGRWHLFVKSLRKFILPAPAPTHTDKRGPDVCPGPPTHGTEDEGMFPASLRCLLASSDELISDQIFHAHMSRCCYPSSTATRKRTGRCHYRAGSHPIAIVVGWGWPQVQNLMMQKPLQLDSDGRGSLFVFTPAHFLLHLQMSINHQLQQPYRKVHDFTKARALILPHSPSPSTHKLSL